MSPKCPLFRGSTLLRTHCPQSVLYSEVPLYLGGHIVPKLSFVQRVHCTVVRTVWDILTFHVCDYLICPALWFNRQICTQQSVFMYVIKRVYLCTQKSVFVYLTVHDSMYDLECTYLCDSLHSIYFSVGSLLPFSAYAASFWLSLRLQLIGAFIITSVAFIAVLERDLSFVDPG